MKLLRAVLLFVALALPAVQARAQVGAVLEDARLAPVRTRLERALAAARSEGLPSEWLLDKIAEGLSKRVPAPRIAAAVDALLVRIRAADAMVREVPGARGEERRRLVRAAVDALAAGAPPEGLGALVREVARGDRSGGPARVREALTTVAELAERDFGGEAAVSATRDAWRNGRAEGMRALLAGARRIGPSSAPGRDEALRRLGREVGRGARRIDPGAQGRDHGRDVPRGRGPR
ncbi:MAG TPA: hypothetical protein VIL20_02815 [Sandaracinaceae bacterium]